MANERSTRWRYGVCGLLLCATMLMYMDRLTLSQLATTIRSEYSLSNEQYGWLEFGFGLAFATGALFFGFLVDRVGPRWLYPLVVIGWSCAGVATAYAQTIGAFFIPDPEPPAMAVIGASTVGLLGSPLGDGPLAAACAVFPGRTPISAQSYLGFMLCRIALGFFEAGHWPCALVTTQVILQRTDRSLGNSILQSGAAFGSILTPPIVLGLMTDELGGWRMPFVVIGSLGMLWTIPWLLMIRPRELDRSPPSADAASTADAGPTASSAERWRMFAVLIVIVITINLTWQYFRVWLPMYLEQSRGYSKVQVGWFISGYYISTDVGCIAVGLAVKWLIGRGWEVHDARATTFTACAGLTLCAVAVAYMPTGPLLLGTLLIVGAGSLGMYPNYYSFAQEISRSHQGKVSGLLGTIAWVGSTSLQPVFGKNIDETKSYALGIVLAGLAPLLACVALWLVWPRRTDQTTAITASPPKA
jgi:ACS family hexuronate transporter-like MFS transporter